MSIRILIPVLVLQLAGMALAAERDVAPRDWMRLHAKIVPQGQEAWQTIPWRVELLAARDEALATGRPLFLWSMNGHPLGCT